MVSMPAMGMTGPEKDYVGYGVTIEQLAGLVSITGYLGDVPMKSGINYGDPIAGIAAAGYLMAALSYRQRTGKGQLVDISQREATACLIGDVIMDYSMNKRIQTPIGNRHSSMVPHGCYRCQGEDMWVTIAVGSDAEWQALCQVMGKPELARDERFADVLSRHRNQDELDVIIEEWTKEHDHYEVMHSLQEVGVMAGAVLNPQEVVEDPHLQARGFYEDVTHPEAGTFCYAGPSWKLSKTPGSIRKPAPCLGEHNDYVYKEILGMSEQEVAELAEEGIISNIPIEATY
jgi:benzylsuccinate CoA-transferase BbsF subunit